MTVGSGLIDRISKAGVERKELMKEAPLALVGGARIPYRPADLAAIITLLKSRNPESYLALEVQALGGLEFIGQNMGGLVLHTVTAHNGSDKDLRTHLRKVRETFDVITIDGRGLCLDAETLWKYIEGGKPAPVREFGKGAPVDYGTPKMRPGCVIVLNLVDPGTKNLYFRLRARYNPMFSSPFVGVVRV